MSLAQIFGYPLLLIAALELLLGLLLLRQNPRNSNTNRSAAACAIAAALWSLSAALMYLRFSHGMDHLLFARFSWIGWFTVPTALQTVLFLEDEKSRKAHIVGWVLYPFWAIVLGLCLSTDLIVTDGYIPVPFTNRPGPIEMPLRFIGSATAFWMIYEIFRLRSRVTGYRRAQLNYYLYGTTFFGMGGAVIGGFLQLFTDRGLEPSLSAYFSFPWVIMIFYAITRFRLFDIRFVVSRTVFILLLSFSISALQFALFKVLEPVLGGVASIFISVPIIGAVFFSTPLSRIVQRWINELVVGRRFGYQAMLRESAAAMITILQQEELLRYIVDSVRNGLGVEKACLYLRSRERGYEIQECYGDDRARPAAGNVPGGFLARLEQDRHPLMREELSSSQRTGDPEIAAALRSLGIELIVPLVTKGQILGFLSLGGRSNGDPYFRNDIDVLQTVAGYAAVAIENARLFEEASRMRASLREQEAIFRTLAQTLPAAIFIHRGGKFLYANPAGVRMTGYSMEEILDMEFWELVHPDYRELIRERGQGRIRGNAVPEQYEFKIIRKDRAERWVLLTAGLIEYGGSAAVIGTIFEITDRKTAEEDRERHYQERIAEQERFSAVLQVTSDGFWITNEENRIIFVNDAYCRMSGYAREELLSKNIADLEAAESPETVERHVNAIRETGHDRFETRHRRKDGSLLDLEVSVNRYKDEKTVFSFHRDITDRKKAEKERARLSEENMRYYRERIAEQARLSTVLQTTSDGFCILSDDARFLFVNEAWCSMLGYERVELLAMSIGDIDVHLGKEQVMAALGGIREKGHGLIETRHRRKDGTVIDVEISVNRYRSENQFFAFLRDVTGRKRSDEALRESEQRFRQVSETAQEWIWEVDREGKYTYSSPVVSTILGFRPEEVVGKRYFYDFFLPGEREQMKREALQIFALKAPFRDFVNRNLHRDGREIVLSTSGMPILDGNGALLGYRGIDFDITGRIRAEEERRRLFEESVTHYQRLLDEQQRHQAEKEKILKDLHDGIGGLTTNINLLAELAQKNDDIAAVRRSLATIAELSRESLSEIRGFMQSLDERELTWQAVAAELRNLGNAIIEPHGMRLSFETAVQERNGGPGSVVAMNLFRIYKESLANIVKHAKASAVDIKFTVDGETARLDVRDDGVGMGSGRGTGRGLANMQARAAETGGTLTIDSGKGTRLLLEIPLP